VLRPIALSVVAVLAVIGFAGLAFVIAPNEPGPSPLPARVDPLLPDLAMGPIVDVAATLGSDGREQLRFAATIVNIGEGQFLLRGRRSTPFADWLIVQRVEERDGGETERPTEATAIFGGDGHDHWHIAGVEFHRLVDIETGEPMGGLVKQGFCFFDTDPVEPPFPGAPAEGVHHPSECGKPWDLRIRMGLSVGWGDRYPWSLVDQRIYIDDVPDGRYRIEQTADLDDLFEESDETNNDISLDIELTRVDGLPEVRVLDAPEPTASL
jgi:hypothetical protein